MSINGNHSNPHELTGRDFTMPNPNTKPLPIAPVVFIQKPTQKRRFLLICDAIDLRCERHLSGFGPRSKPTTKAIIIIPSTNNASVTTRPITSDGITARTLSFTTPSGDKNRLATDKAMIAVEIFL